MSAFSENHDWSNLKSPEEIKSEQRYSLNPLILEEHASRHGKTMVKEVKFDHIRYSILSDEKSCEDATQSNWRFEYGAEFYFDGSVRPFLNTTDQIDRPEEYAETIAEEIFPRLEKRSLEFYEEN